MENIESNGEPMSKSWAVIKPADEKSTEESKIQWVTDFATMTTTLTVLLFSSDGSEESSDGGISVISDTELQNTFKYSIVNNDSDSEDEKEVPDGNGNNCDTNYNPITPPSTPKEDFNEKEKPNDDLDQEQSGVYDIQFSKALVIGMLLIITICMVYHKINSLTIEIQTISEKVSLLEKENNHLKAALEILESTMSYDIGTVTANAINQEAKRDKNTKKRDTPSPKTKTVWVGDNHEDEVEILDKKSKGLPDYCYFTDENDLFFEYNQELCGRKKQKLESKHLSEEEADLFEFGNDWKYANKQSSYEALVNEALKTLGDEIKRGPVIDRKDLPTFIDYSPADDSPSQSGDGYQEKPKKSKEGRRGKKRLNKQRAQLSDDWTEKRTSGREEARKNLQRQQQKDFDSINWYLKRKNERDNRRIKTSDQEQNV